MYIISSTYYTIEIEYRFIFNYIKKKKVQDA